MWKLPILKEYAQTLQNMLVDAEENRDIWGESLTYFEQIGEGKRTKATFVPYKLASVILKFHWDMQYDSYMQWHQ